MAARPGDQCAVFQSRDRSSMRHPHRAQGRISRREGRFDFSVTHRYVAEPEHRVHQQFYSQETSRRISHPRAVSCVPSAVDVENYGASWTSLSRSLQSSFTSRSKTGSRLDDIYVVRGHRGVKVHALSTETCVQVHALSRPSHLSQTLLMWFVRSSKELTGHIAQDRNMIAQGG